VDELQEPIERTVDKDDLPVSPARVEPRPGRRGFLRLLGRLGLGVVGGVAGVTAAAGPAGAHPRPPCGGNLYHVACCCLVFPPGGCPGTPPSINCPGSSRKRTWGCCSGRRFYQCIECTTGPNCKTGSFRCSEVWDTRRIC
jgi:hypothetical protein